MKIIKESKQEKLPIEFLTQTVSRFWDEVGNLKASIDGIKREFAGTREVEKILQEVVDSYLIAIGQLELHLDKKDYVELPEKEELKEDCDEELILKNNNNLVNKELEVEKVEEELSEENEDKVEEEQIEEKESINNFIDEDFPEVEPDAEADKAIQDWLKNRAE